MEFIHGNKKVFETFIKNINVKDKIALISHNDVDGIVSAFLLHEYLVKKGFNVSLKKFMTYKKNFMGDLIKELKENGITVVCITDLQVDSDDFEGFKKLSLEVDTLLLDHHPLHNNKDEYEKLHVIKCPSSHSTGYMVYNLGQEILSEDYFEELMFASLICTPYKGQAIGVILPLCMKVSETVTKVEVQIIIDLAYEKAQYTF